MKINNRITQLFAKKPTNILSVFVTAGYPQIDSTTPLILELASRGIDLVEIGMPFSDPIADGKTIQETSTIALQNGITTDLIFDSVRQIRAKSEIPVVLMGYYNSVFKYGFKKFLETAKSAGADGIILPDLPSYEYKEIYQAEFERLDLSAIFLITSETTESRIRELDELSSGFLYAVSTAGITGITAAIDSGRIEYLKRLNSLRLRNPVLVGFGINNREQIKMINEHANGVIIGSAFLKAIRQDKNEKSLEDLMDKARNFIGLVSS